MTDEFEELFKFLKKEMIEKGLEGVHEEIMATFPCNVDNPDYKEQVILYLDSLKKVMRLYSPQLTQETINLLNENVVLPDDVKFEEVFIDEVKLAEHEGIETLINNVNEVSASISAFDPEAPKPGEGGMSLG